MAETDTPTNVGRASSISQDASPILRTTMNIPWSPLTNLPSVTERTSPPMRDSTRQPTPMAALADAELQQLLALTADALTARNLPLPRALSLSQTAKHDIYDNARFEQIACAGLPQKYDGSPDNLIPTLNLIHIRRLNEVWGDATYFTRNGAKIDLIQHFSKVTLQEVKDYVTKIWSAPDANILHHKRGTALYNSRLFGLFLMNSLTPEFSSLLYSRLDTRFSLDGQLIFVTLCNHIHRNHLAFVELVKTKIRMSSLAEFKNDVPAYLRFLNNNLRVITSTGDAEDAHNDLIPHLFLQLRHTTIPMFQQAVLRWQRKYMENSLKLNPITLVTLADEECQVLKHSSQWVETIDPSVTAMQALFQTTTQGTTKIFEQ